MKSNPRSGEEEYAAITRPTGSIRYMVPSIFLFTSSDLYHWEDHGILIEGTEKGHVGVNTPPIELENGWLIIYHQHRHRDDGEREYIVSLKLFNRDISRLLKEADVFMDPHMDAQKKGIVDNVVFPGAAILHEDERLFVYAGGADRVTTVHIYKLNNIMDFLKPVRV